MVETRIGPTLPLQDYQLAGAGMEFVDMIQERFRLSPLLNVFDATSVGILADYMQVYTLTAQQLLLKEGEQSDFAILLLDGVVSVNKLHSDGTQHTIATIGPGKLIGEMSLIDGEPRFATCQAGTDVRVAVLTRQSLLGLLEDHPKLGSLLLMRLVALVSHRLRQTSARLVEALSQTANKETS